jgi:hypothetical protein
VSFAHFFRSFAPCRKAKKTLRKKDKKMENAGYTIIQSEIYNAIEMHGVALGFNGYTYVTWEFSVNDKREYDFFWGHYITDTFAAHIDYHERLVKLYRERAERIKSNERE